MARKKDTPSIEDRLAEFGTLDRPVTLEEIELSLPFTERVIAPILSGLAQFAMRLSPAESQKALQHKLDLAGNPYEMSKFMGTRLLAGILFGGLGIVGGVFAGNLAFFQRILMYRLQGIKFFAEF